MRNSKIFALAVVIIIWAGSFYDGDLNAQPYNFLPGDVNMAVAPWPPTLTGADVTYLVNYFRGAPTSLPCCIATSPAFWCSADVNGDCHILGNDVTKLVNYFRGIGILDWCRPRCHPPQVSPGGWPGCMPCP
jgi:hypothetical protein